MIRIRRRLISWLIKAYIKKWGNLILLYFAIGLIVFFVFRLALGVVVTNLHFLKKETIGMIGAYNMEDLPPSILYKISRGLTTVSKDGTVRPDVALKWRIGDNGKSYVFYLRDDIYFSDGINLTSDLIRYNFTDVSVERPNKYTIVYKLKDNYSPFPVTVSKPIFKDGLIGVSEDRLKDIKLNGTFVQSLDLVSKNGDRIIYQFYPTNNALKIAYSLGEVSKIVGISNVKFKNTTFQTFNNAKVERQVNYKQLVTLFYNTSDKLLSSKTLREALSYTIPDIFSEGLRNSSPFSPLSFASQDGTNSYRQDLRHAKLLLEKYRNETSAGGDITLTLDTFLVYNNVAKLIVKELEKIGLHVNIRIAPKIPSTFQIFLGEFNLPLDPDQYTLWHSDQPSNITHYNNLRVDKLLEDGRRTIGIEKRKAIYADFQKFIQSDPPASFLFFPYTYDVTRK